MNCNSVTLASIDARCDSSFGGIKEVLVGLKDDVKSISVDSATGMINTLTLNTGKKMEKFLFRKNTGSYTSTVTSDPTIGNSFATTEVTLQFSKAEATKRLAIQSAINASSVVIVRDMYDQYLLLGYENEVVVSAATMQSGTQASDLSGFTLTFQDIATELPHFIDTSSVTIDSLLVAGA